MGEEDVQVGDDAVHDQADVDVNEAHGEEAQPGEELVALVQPGHLEPGVVAGLAGGVKVFVAQNASLTDVHWSMSGEIVLMTLVGGLGTIFGPVVGAFVVIAMQQYLAGFGQWVTVIQGVIFVLCVLTFRRGIVGEIAHLFRRSL